MTKQLKKPKVTTFKTFKELVDNLKKSQPDAIPDKKELSFYRKLGVWAYCQFSGTGYTEIFLWIAPKTDPKWVAYVLGHELGHLSGTPLLLPWDEEPRADTYGRVVQLTMEIMSDLGLK